MGSWENELLRLPLLLMTPLDRGVLSAFCAVRYSFSLSRYVVNVFRVVCASSSRATSTEDTSKSACSMQQMATRRILLSRFTELNNQHNTRQQNTRQSVITGKPEQVSHLVLATYSSS